MENQPAKIYLQAEGDDFEDHDQVTWCVDKIGMDDLEYVSLGLLSEQDLRDELCHRGADLYEPSMPLSMAPDRGDLCFIATDSGDVIKEVWHFSMIALLNQGRCFSLDVSGLLGAALYETPNNPK